MNNGTKKENNYIFLTFFAPAALESDTYPMSYPWNVVSCLILVRQGKMDNPGIIAEG